MIFKLEFLFNIIINIVMITIFICIFFFTYAKNVEKRIIVSQTVDLANSITNTITTFPDLRNQLRPFVDSWAVTESKNEKVEQSNKMIVENTIMIIGFWSFWILLIVFILAYIYKINLTGILLVNLIILIVVGMTELFFLECIATNYISFDPNFVRYTLIDTLDRFEQKNKILFVDR